MAIYPFIISGLAIALLTGLNEILESHKPINPSAPHHDTIAALTSAISILTPTLYISLLLYLLSHLFSLIRASPSQLPKPHNLATNPKHKLASPAERQQNGNILWTLIGTASPKYSRLNDLQFLVERVLQRVRNKEIDAGDHFPDLQYLSRELQRLQAYATNIHSILWDWKEKTDWYKDVTTEELAQSVEPMRVAERMLAVLGRDTEGLVGAYAGE